MIGTPKSQVASKKIRAVLALQSHQLQQQYAAAVRGQCDMELVGQATDPVDLLLEVRRTEADVVVLSWPDNDCIPPVCTHLFAEYNELLVVGVSADGTDCQMCQQQIVQTPLSTVSSSGILSAIRSSCDSVLLESRGGAFGN